MRKKCMIIAGALTLTIAIVPGCATTSDAANTNATLTTEAIPDKASEQQSGVTDDSAAEDSAQDNEENQVPDDSTQENIKGDVPSDANKETVNIGGRVRSVAQDSCVISRTLIDDGFVTMPEEGSPEEELVTVKCTDSTTFEHWTIQGEGAGINKRDASFSEIQTGGGLEATGYFDGEDFIAEKIIIEVYE